jgi:glycosyl hydrolase family 42 (putative beta-galactosidase)
MRATSVFVIVSILAMATVCMGIAVEELADKEVALKKAIASKSVYGPWKNGPSADPGYFPIGVWAQRPGNAGKYAKLGINLYLGLHGGPTEKQLAELKKHGMKTICAQNVVGLANLDNPTIVGWMHGDEPDNFTKNDAGKWVPKHKPEKIIADYQAIRKKDPSRPVLLNLGQGVSNDFWKGGWAKEKDYREFVKGCDIVSYDIYPACATRKEVTGKLELCAKGVDRLRDWSGDKKTVWFIVEASHIQNPDRMATPDEIRYEVWSSIIHGAKGIIYFCHQWKPKRDFAAPLNNPVTRDAVTAVNKQIAELAPVLNSPTVSVNGASATSSNAKVPVDIMVKRHGGATYVFAAAMRGEATQATVTLNGKWPPTAKVEVVGENRTLEAAAGKFTDDFKGYDVHIYRIAAGK